MRGWYSVVLIEIHGGQQQQQQQLFVGAPQQGGAQPAAPPPCSKNRNGSYKHMLSPGFDPG